ncbi:DNA-binding protein [Escherichia coli]|uniref:DNA-binding protein n=1 Tax=Escherichia coli TaxID=562 RepID=A0A2X3KA63_ECOLX|nr:DNA-binding protein [Escherichia coli]
MNTAIFNGKASMTSVEIAELVGSRPDSVKRTIETLAKKGIIQFPQTVEIENKQSLGLADFLARMYSKVNEVSATASLSSHSSVLNSLLAW